MATGFEAVQATVPFSENGNIPADLGPEFHMMTWMVQASAGIPAYWSRARERWLRDFVIQSGPVKGALSTFINKTVTIPFRISANDRSIDRHIAQADLVDEMLRRNSGSAAIGPLKGFKTTLKMFLRDYLTQDSGAYMVVMGRGRADGPILGAATGLMHLDSARCTPTSDPEFPVRYLHTDSVEYKIHYTRIIQMVNLPSADVSLLGVGLCPVSCCIEAAQELWNIYTNSEESFGSRPPKQILYAETGATIGNLETAIDKWNLKLNNEGRLRFGGTLLLAPRMAQQTLKLGLIDLNKAPDGFNRQDVTIADKGEIAAAFGLDLRDLAVASNVGQTRADAEVQERKGRGKGIGEFIETLREELRLKYLSKALGIDFDYVDDEQDEQQANIWNVRSQARERDLRAGVTTVRVERERMWDLGEISQQQFEDMELVDGRLPNGLDVLLLFQSPDADFMGWLDLGQADPTNVESNDVEQMLTVIHEKIIEVSQQINEQQNPLLGRRARQALAALDKLRGMYEVKETEMEAEQQALEQQQQQEQAAAQATVGGDQPPTPPPQPMTKELPATAELLLDEYERRFRDLVDRALTGDLERNRFLEEIATLIAELLLALFLRGANLQNSEITRAEFGVIQDAIQTEINYAGELADDIYGGVVIGSAILARIPMWMTTAAGVYALGQLQRRDDPYYAWRLGPTEHCRDCNRLAGQVHKASEWAASRYRPQSDRLECTGINCQCFFEEVSGPSQGVF